ncbi:hypothetical protein [Dictyobacter formicarum]|uniref:hypothetical protein n=1 Tax=Dictyobacter formicarum TaxID=2778368 RepID=UPI001915186F|nr:hypothetical protein [Dictyobacter formicarum]
MTPTLRQQHIFIVGVIALFALLVLVCLVLASPYLTGHTLSSTPNVIYPRS